ncbi:biopolymer transporter [Caulobacter sp. Root1455]|uniref:biopolymer transporter ExbD n=1 Tax=unclassified Caulobacter TaxID=2648921 RepID=UPI0006F3704C|nr:MULTISPECIES: biopolymer transporter ExbD [unclassified Caulobacter]KQY29622.1 biopolymer transporter [Caulobacter sp. Root487D2Y]KQY95798.1 biopolymer transporter [Caulobacter sp. Root1455]
MGAKLAGNSGGRYAIQQNADINVTPFVDILLVLLIIFMVAVPIATTSIKLDMPPASDKVAPKEPVFISIQNSGALFLAGQPTSLKTLAQDLNAKFAANGQKGPRKDQRLMVSAQADVPYEALMGVIDRVHTEGWTQIGIINEDLH